MFLNQLKDTNKEDFLKVCVFASLSNGVFADEEKETLFAYCREMNIKEHIPETSGTFEDLVEKICEETCKKEKNIYILEILALIKADGIYDNEEQEFMERLAVGLELSASVLEKFSELLEKYIAVGKELAVAIEE